MTELTLEDLQVTPAINSYPKDSIEVGESFIGRVNILSNYVKDFMLEEQKLLFLSGVSGTKELKCYFCNNIITVEWTEELKTELTTDLTLTLDLRFLNKLLVHCKHAVVMCYLDTEPSLWLYNNAVKLLVKNLTVSMVKFKPVQLVKDMFKIPLLSEITDIIKKYHLDRGCLSYSKDAGYYYKNFNATTTGIFKAPTKLPLESLSLETLKLVTFFSEGQVYANNDFNIISWNGGAFSTALLYSKEEKTCSLLGSKPSFSLDVDTLKQLLKIIKITHNTIQLNLKVHQSSFILEGFIEGQKCMEYSIPTEVLTKVHEVEIPVVLDAFLEVIKEFTGIINIATTADSIEFTDNTYYLVLKQS